ncbi:hypothetical protein OIU76_020454 [Salix suchowensis]|nr:hypothetical protein OIU76_020454 [Salix suchowensis]
MPTKTTWASPERLCGIGERVIAGSILGPSYARSPISSPSRRHFYSPPPKTVSPPSPNPNFADMADRGAGGERGRRAWILAVGSAAQAENADDEVVAAVLAVMRRKNGSPLPS